MRRILLALCCLLPLVAGACESSPTAASIEETTFAAGLDVDLAAMTRTASGLYLRDRVVGTGATAGTGQTVAVHYTLHLANGQQIDANQPPRTPLSFRVGDDGFIAGFNEGVAGMRVGGRRQLVIPPALGYGSTARPGLPANSILVFTVDLVSVQ